MNAIISYRPNTQKIYGGFRRVLSHEILQDITRRITGQSSYAVNELHDTYNRGRLLTLEYNGMVNYVSLSEVEIAGRNSSLQSVPTALNIFYKDNRVNKKLWYYFIPYEGNPFTEYHLLYYRLMATAGIEFLNIGQYYDRPLSPYRNIDELIIERDLNRGSNKSNNSSFVTKTSDRIQLYAKTYGASKYESTVLAVAISNIADKPVDVFAVSEQDLVNLPASSLSTFAQLGNIDVYNTSLKLNRLLSNSDNNIRLRSAAYNFNLLDRIGMKKCALCGCEIPEIINGSHIWSVADIKNCSHLTEDQKYIHAVNGHNGLWLCSNHHKLFDSNYIVFDTQGKCLQKESIPETHKSFIRNSILTPNLSCDILSDDFLFYLQQRNQNIAMTGYRSL